MEGVGAIGLGREEEEEDDDHCAEQGERAARAVYCAVGTEAAKEWKANLQWALANFPRTRCNRLVLAHVHRPASRINMSGSHLYTHLPHDAGQPSGMDRKTDRYAPQGLVLEQE